MERCNFALWWSVRFRLEEGAVATSLSPGLQDVPQKTVWRENLEVQVKLNLGSETL